MTPDPFLAKVTQLVWRISDPRVLKHLRAENDPGRSPAGRAKVIGERARAAGWPEAGIDRSRRVSTAAVRRLEGVDFFWNNSSQHALFSQTAAYESRSRGREVTVEVDGYDNDDGADAATIFDE